MLSRPDQASRKYREKQARSAAHPPPVVITGLDPVMTKVLETNVLPLVPRGRTCSGHPRPPRALCRTERRRGWPGRARPGGTWVVSGCPKTTKFDEPDSCGSSPAMTIVDICRYLHRTRHP